VVTHDTSAELSASEVRRVHAVRSGLREFHRWSRSQLHAAGLTPARHELLLAIKALNSDGGPSISAVAAALAITHHSAVELANHAQTAGQIHRERDPQDGRVVRLTLTAAGEQVLNTLAPHHREELHRLGLLLEATTH